MAQQQARAADVDDAIKAETNADMATAVANYQELNAATHETNRLANAQQHNISKIDVASIVF